jgi:hypothetical protein
MKNVMAIIALLMFAGCSAALRQHAQVAFGEKAILDAGRGYTVRLDPKEKDWHVAVCRRGATDDLFHMRPPAKNYGPAIQYRMPHIASIGITVPTLYFWEYRDDSLSGRLTALVRPEEQGISIEIKGNEISNKMPRHVP